MKSTRTFTKHGFHPGNTKKKHGNYPYNKGPLGNNTETTLENFFEDSGLIVRLNTNKTKMIHFCNKQSRTQRSRGIILQGKKIEVEDHFKYLGIALDTH